MLRSVVRAKSGPPIRGIQQWRVPKSRSLPSVTYVSAVPSSASCGIHKSHPVGLHFDRNHGTPLVWRGSLFHFSRHLHVGSQLLDDVDVMTPPFAESITQGDIRWEKAVNDTVDPDEVLAEIETDKTNIPVVSPASGLIVELYVEDGATVEAGSKLCRITTSTSGGAPAKKKETTPASDPPKQSPAAPAPLEVAQPPPVTPTVPIDTPIPSTLPPIPPLPGQPISQAVPPPPPPPPVRPSAVPSGDFSSGNRIERRVKLSRMRQRIAERLKEAQNVNAMLTTFNEIDMSNVIALRAKYKEDFLKKHGVKLGFMSAFVSASVHALQNQPVVNAVIEAKEIVYRDYIDISVAVATPKGLVVPVLRNAERMNFADIELGISELGIKANEGTLSVEDMDGGTFTISNGGVFGSLYGTPIINPPQSAILGMHATKDRPVAINGKVEVRPMMYVALTYDHRLIDGREAVLFLKKIKSAVEDPQVVLLDI